MPVYLLMQNIILVRNFCTCFCSGRISKCPFKDKSRYWVWISCFLNFSLLAQFNSFYFFFLHVSASSPLSNISAPARGVVTMRCDVCTSASARISLLVAGSAHICLDDQVSNKIVLGVPKSSFLQRCKLIAAQQYIHYALLKCSSTLRK